jgi:hypothetical protein
MLATFEESRLLAGHESTAPTTPPRRKLPPNVADAYDRGRRELKVRMLRNQCGLNTALITPEHLEIFGQIADVLPNNGFGTHPLNTVQEERQLGRVRELLLQLPQTPPIRSYLASTKNGAICPAQQWKDLKMENGILEDSVESLTRLWLTEQLGVRWMELTPEQQGTVGLIAGMVTPKDEPLPLRRLAESDRPAVF